MVILRASYIVKSAEQTAKRLMSLSEFDQVAAITHSTIVLFYRSNNDYEFDFAGRILKDSLSKALVTFYPLAGRLYLTGRDRFELDCNSMGAQLLVAESNAKIEDFGDFHPSPQLQALVPHVDYSTPFHEIPLLMLQLTKLAEGGLCLGVAISHIIADAGSAFHFINELAKIARGEESNNPTFFDRTILQAEEPSPPPSFEHLEYCPPPLLVGRSDAEDEQPEETTVGKLKLTREQIEKLMAKANKGQPGGNPARAYTKFEAMAGHVWRCASKARKHMMNQQLTRLYFPIDVRKRVEPKLSPGYFGNAVCRAAASSMSRELQSQPLCYASSKIREAINMVSDVYVRSSLCFLKNHQHLSQHRTSHAPGSVQGVFHGNPNMVINTLEKVPISDADFGWGKLIHMGPTALGSDGKSVIIPCLDEDGSFNILFRLQVAYMEDFLNFFYADI